MKNPKDFELKVEGMSTRYVVKGEEKKYYFLDEEDAQMFGQQVLKQNPCLAVSALLPNPTEEEMLCQLFAYQMELSMKSECEGCDKDYPSQLDHACLMDWEVRVEDEFETYYNRACLTVMYKTRLNRVFGIDLHWQNPSKDRIKKFYKKDKLPNLSV